MLLTVKQAAAELANKPAWRATRHTWQDAVVRWLEANPGHSHRSEIARILRHIDPGGYSQQQANKINSLNMNIVRMMDSKRQLLPYLFMLPAQFPAQRSKED